MENVISFGTDINVSEMLVENKVGVAMGNPSELVSRNTVILLPQMLRMGWQFF